MADEIQKQNNQVATVSQEEIITSLVLTGDLSKMNDVQKVDYYNRFCAALQLNPLTQPFEIINLKGKLRLYATKSCTEQLRRINGISVTELIPSLIGTIYTVISKGVDKSGRVDAATAAIDIKGLSGENLANAYMKCETKSKRRLTLSMSGLGILDETEIESINPNEHAPTNTSRPEAVKTEVALATSDDYDTFIKTIDNPLLGDKLFGGKRDKGSFRATVISEYEAGTWAKDKFESIMVYLKKDLDEATKGDPMDGYDQETADATPAAE